MTHETPDFEEAQAFLDLLDKNAQFWTFQTFDDNADRRSQDLARVLHGTLEDHFDTLTALQKRGAGVFVTINETDGKGRGKRNIIRVRAQYIDLDGADLQPVRDWLEPDIICDTSPGRWHAYWLVRDTPLEKFSAVQKYLIRAFDADNVHDLPRVMRLPGFFHQKKDSGKGLTGKRQVVRVLPTANLPKERTFKDFGTKLKADFPLPDKDSSKPKKSQPNTEKSEAQDAEVLEALGYIDPDQLSYDEWLRVLFGLHHQFGSAGDAMADDWSAKGQKHRPDDIDRRWNKFREDGRVTIKSVFDLAKKNGCDVAALAKKHRGKKKSRPAPLPFKEIIETAKGLSAEDTDDIAALLIEVSSLPPLKREKVLLQIKKSTKMTLGSLRAQLRFDQEVDESNHLTVARKVIGCVGADNIICVGEGLWLWNETGVWQEEDNRLLRQKTQAVLEDHNINVVAATVGSITDVLKSEIYRQDHKFNLGNPETVNCLNGEIQLEDNDWLDPGKWRCHPHEKQNYRTTQIPVKYDPNADAPRFRQFLNEIFEPDNDGEEKIQALLEMMGYTLMSHSRHEKFIMLIGAGANGKSVLLSVIEALCGVRNVSGVQPANFDRTFQRAHLHMKLANIVTELKQGEVIADAELKAITSGEPSTVEQKFKDPFLMRPFSTCWFGTNHMPHTRDFSEALFRRAVIITFNRVFSDSEKDPILKETLFKELPGILNMALDAYAEALVHDFTEPPSSICAKQEWKLEADQVAQFVEDACKVDANAEINVTKLYGRYKIWTDSQGINKTLGIKNFRDRLSRLGYGHKRRSDGKYVTGLTVTESSITEFDV
ncbi:phage/plasmid primase, P4 family [Yoonia sp.]|uniref:phage/plasmid primase, P4 family n=1 Tax=Yoonia sp. TaxID=2212373 RepID=UPI00236A8E0F|nr:phage/plasmid primase, P4 family [Yoonia sp.]MDB4112128.1 phage/plasmid primase, P4 family [Yoonia sp.]